MNAKKRLVIVALLFVMVLVLGVACAGTDETDNAEDEAKIMALWDEYGANWAAGDMENWIALWANDGIQMPPGVQRNVGKEKIQTAMQPELDAYDYEMSINPDEVQILGDQAYSYGLYEFAYTPKAGGDSTNGYGKFLTVLERQDDDSWKIALDCFSYNPPPDGSANNDDAETDEADDVAKIEAVWDEYVAGIKGKDFDRWSAVWADDGLRVTPSEFGPRQFGKDEIQAVVEPAFAVFEQEMSIDAEGIEILGDKAYSYGTFEFFIIPGEGDDTIVVAGNFLTILEKQEDDSWKIIIDTWNY